MPFTRPTLQQIINRIESDAEALLTGRIALLQRAVIRIFARLIAASSHIAYGFIQSGIDTLLPDTATGDAIDRHAFIWGVTRKAATFANGPVLFTGVEGAAIPINTSIQDSFGNEFLTTVDTTIVDGIAFVYCEAKIPGTSGNINTSLQLSLIAPLPDIASEVYAGEWALTYDNLSGGIFGVGDLLTNDTQSGIGRITDDNGSSELKLVIISGNFADDDDFHSDAGVSAQVNGVLVFSAGIVGGQEAEDDTALQERILQRIQFQPSGGTVADFERWSREVTSGNGIVSGAWCFPATPSPGYVTVVVRAGGIEPVPSAGLIADVADYLDLRRPVTCDVIVEPIVKVLTAMTISISPDTSALRSIINTKLTELFAIEAEPGSPMLISHIRAAISSSGVYDFTITDITLTPGGSTSPNADIPATGFQYLVLSTLTF